MRPLVTIEGVSKTYPHTHRARDRFRAMLGLLAGRQSLPGKTVLQDISLDIRAGESMGIVGENGAGKSTLLKMLCGVLRPSSGRIVSHGSMAALLELGAGFQPDYTGLENVRMKAALLGQSRPEVERHLDQILEFADIGDAINEPVKHYSSGMVVRLGFAVITTVRPDLLVTDEVLAVGDESFQKKCIRWMEEYLQGGGTLLMVSHNLYQVQRLCQQACWIRDGRMEQSGDVFEVTQAYLAWHEKKSAMAELARREGRAGSGLYSVRELRLSAGGQQSVAATDDAEQPVLQLPQGDALSVHLEFESPDDRAPVAGLGVVRADGTPVYGISSDQVGATVRSLAPGRFGCQVDYPGLSLLPGAYTLRAHAMDPEGINVHDTVELPFVVTGRNRALGLVELETRWS